MKLCDCGGDKNTEKAHTGKLVNKKLNEDIREFLAPTEAQGVVCPSVYCVSVSLCVHDMMLKRALKRAYKRENFKIQRRRFRSHGL